MNIGSKGRAVKIMAHLVNLRRASRSASRLRTCVERSRRVLRRAEAEAEAEGTADPEAAA